MNDTEIAAAALTAETYGVALRRDAPVLARQIAARQGEAALREAAQQHARALLQEALPSFARTVMEQMHATVLAQAEEAVSKVDPQQVRTWAAQQARRQVARASSAPVSVLGDTVDYTIDGGSLAAPVTLTGTVEKARSTYALLATTSATEQHAQKWRANAVSQAYATLMRAAVEQHAVPACRTWVAEQAKQWADANRAAYLAAVDTETLTDELRATGNTYLQQAGELRARIRAPRPRLDPPRTRLTHGPADSRQGTSEFRVVLDVIAPPTSTDEPALPSLTLRSVLPPAVVPEHDHTARRVSTTVERDSQGRITATIERDLDNPSAPAVRRTVQRDSKGTITGSTADLQT